MVDWLTKYRPRRLDEILGQDKVVSRLKNWAKGSVEDMLNFLFIGEGGTGKTSAARAFCWDAGYYYNILNAAEYNTKDKLLSRNFEKAFKVQSHMSDFEVWEDRDGNEVRTGGMVWIVEKAENLNDNAQDYLEQIMDDASSAKLIYCCNEKNFTSPFLGRLEKFEFKKVENKDMEKILFWIASKEGFDIPDNLLMQILKEADGIPRNAVRGLYEYYIQNEKNK